MASFNFKKYLPYIIILAALFVLALFFAYPALSGKVLSQGDNVSWKGMSHEASEEFARTGEPVLWSNSMFGGMPTYTFYLGRTANYVAYIETFIQTILPKPAYFFFIAMACCFLLMRVLGVNRWLAGIGAIAYAFSSYNPVIISAGHDTKMLAMGYMPGVIAGILLIYRGRWLIGMATAGILFALMFQNQHFQIVMYMGFILLFMGVCLLYLAIREKWVKRFVIATVLTLVTLALGAGPSMPPFLTTFEYSKTTMRGGQSELTIDKSEKKKSGGLDKDYAFNWSNGIGETFCILVPYLYGGASGEEAKHAPVTSEQVGPGYDRLPTYWGPQPSLSGPVYFGAVICFLFVLGMLVIRSPHKWWMAGVSLLAIMMSWGSHFKSLNYFLFDTIPYFNVFRTPSMVLVIPQLLFPVVAVWGIQDLLMDYSSEEKRKEIWKKVQMAAGITGGLALLLGVGGSLFFDFTNPARDAQYKGIVEFLKEDRAAMARNSGLLSAFYIAAAAGLVWAFLKSKASSKTLMAGLAVLVCIDLIPVAWRYLNESNYVEADEYQSQFTPRPADQQVLDMGKGDPYYRVLDIKPDIFNDAVQAYFHKCVGGYSPAKMEIYQDLIDVHLSRGFNSQVVNMLNTRFLIVPAGEGQSQAIPNPDACGNAWFVSGIKHVNTADEEILALKATTLGDTLPPQPGDFKPLETAVVRNSFAGDLQGLTPHKDSASYVRLKKYGLNEISYTSDNSAEGLAVFSDIWYPLGWKAYVDGKETPIVRANYVLRALRLPAGKHEIVFKFHPKKFYTGNTIAGVSSLMLFALLIGGIWVAFKKDQEEEARA